MENITIIVLGEMGAGKSSICTRYVQGLFMEFYDPTIENIYRKIFDLDGKTYSLEIIDTAGSNYFEVLRDMHTKKGDGFILVFSLISFATFNNVSELYEKIQLIREDKVPMILVGNKFDLEDMRVISYRQGKALADSILCPYFETSAKNNTNVPFVFENLIHQIRSQRTVDTPIKKKKRCSLF